MTIPWLNARQDQQLRDGLRDLPELGALAATALPGEHLGRPTGGRSVPGSRPPLQIGALDLTRRKGPAADPVAAASRARTEIAWVSKLDGRARPDAGLDRGILDVLAGWTRLAEAEMLDAGLIGPDTLASVPTVESETAWLLRHVLWLLDQQWIVELADDVRAMVRDCRAILRERPEYRPSCPGCHATLTEERGHWHCPDCDYIPEDRRLDLRSVVAQQQPMTVGELTRAFGWSSKTVESWVQRDRLQPVDPEQRPRRYHVLDALRLADAGGASATP